MSVARAWHTTADEAKKAGKDSSEALKKAGASLEGAAKWSGNKLTEGAQASVEAVKKVGTRHSERRKSRYRRSQ